MTTSSICRFRRVLYFSVFTTLPVSVTFAVVNMLAGTPLGYVYALTSLFASGVVIHEWKTAVRWKTQPPANQDELEKKVAWLVLGQATITIIGYWVLFASYCTLDISDLIAKAATAQNTTIEALQQSPQWKDLLHKVKRIVLTAYGAGFLLWTLLQGSIIRKYLNLTKSATSYETVPTTTLHDPSYNSHSG